MPESVLKTLAKLEGVQSVNEDRLYVGLKQLI